MPMVALGTSISVWEGHTLDVVKMVSKDLDKIHRGPD